MTTRGILGYLDVSLTSGGLIGKVTKLNGTSVPVKRPPGKGDDNDLPRERRNADPLRDRAARIGDPRNDENLIVAQLHAVFLRLHNKRRDEGKTFEQAQQLLRWHYQWLIVNDYLPHIVGRDLIAVDRRVPVLREHDRDFGADARAGGAVGLAVALVLHLNLAVLDAVDVEQTEAQTLHAVGAARVVDDREPRLPAAGGGRAARLPPRRSARGSWTSASTTSCPRPRSRRAGSRSAAMAATRALASSGPTPPSCEWPNASLPPPKSLNMFSKAGITKVSSTVIEGDESCRRSRRSLPKRKTASSVPSTSTFITTRAASGIRAATESSDRKSTSLPPSNRILDE